MSSGVRRESVRKENCRIPAPPSSPTLVVVLPTSNKSRFFPMITPIFPAADYDRLLPP